MQMQDGPSPLIPAPHLTWSSFRAKGTCLIKSQPHKGRLSSPCSSTMPPPAIDTNRDEGYLVPRSLSGPTQGVVIGTLVGSFVFFGLLIWLYHCVNEDKGAYRSPLYYRPPSPPRRLRNFRPRDEAIPAQGRSYSLSPPRAPRLSGGLRAPVNSPLRTVRRATSLVPPQPRGNLPLRPRASSPLRPRAPPPPRTPSPRPRTPPPRAPQIRVQAPSVSTPPQPRKAQPAAPPPGRDLGLDLERARARDLHHDLERTIPPRDPRPTALQLERERDLARRMAEENSRERLHRSLSSSSGRRRQPRIVVAEPGNPARRPPPSSTSSSSIASSGPVIVMAEPGRPARRRAAPASSSSSSSSGPIIVRAEPENSAHRGQRPPPSSSSSTLVPLASRNGRRGGTTRSQPPTATTVHPALGSPITLAEPRRPRPPPSSSSLSSSLGGTSRGRRRMTDPAELGRLPFPSPPPSHYGKLRASDARDRNVVAATNELRHPSRRPSSSVSSSQGPPRGRARDSRDSGRRLPPCSASSAGGRSDGVRSNVSYERVRRVPGAWRD